MILSYDDKRRLEDQLEQIIIQNHPNWTKTTDVVDKAYTALKDSIAGLNAHHVSGMLSYVHKKYGHQIKTTTSGDRVIK